MPTSTRRAPIRRLESRAQRVVGLFEKGKDGFGRLTPDRQAHQDRVLDPSAGYRRCTHRRSGDRRSGAGAAPGHAQGARGRAHRPRRRAALDQPHLHRRAPDPVPVPAGRTDAGEGSRAGDARQAHRSAPGAAGHHRRRRCARLRRRGVRRARHRSEEPGRLAPAGRDRRRRALRARPATRSTRRRASAATRSISPTASCRCCRRSCPTAGAR